MKPGNFNAIFNKPKSERAKNRERLIKKYGLNKDGTIKKSR